MRIAPLLGCATALLIAGCIASPKVDTAPPDATQRRAAVGFNADAVAGQAAYDEWCGSCHRLGDYDSQGSINLARHAHHVEPSFLENHYGTALSPQEAADLQAFIRSR